MKGHASSVDDHPPPRPANREGSPGDTGPTFIEVDAA